MQAAEIKYFSNKKGIKRRNARKDFSPTLPCSLSVCPSVLTRQANLKEKKVKSFSLQLTTREWRKTRREGGEFYRSRGTGQIKKLLSQRAKADSIHFLAGRAIRELDSGTNKKVTFFLIEGKGVKKMPVLLSSPHYQEIHFLKSRSFVRSLGKALAGGEEKIFYFIGHSLLAPVHVVVVAVRVELF